MVALIPPWPPNADANDNLNAANSASFDGERILVTNGEFNTVTLFKAADLSLIANISTGTGFAFGACGDGINFWLPFEFSQELARFQSQQCCAEKTDLARRIGHRTRRGFLEVARDALRPNA